MGLAITALAGCAGTQTLTGAPAGGAQGRSVERLATQQPITHLIVVVQQDRSFDDLFSGYPGADAPRFGCASSIGWDVAGSKFAESGCPPGDSRVPLKAVRLAARPCALSSSFADYFSIAWDHAKMDGWNRLDPKAPLCPYSRVTTRDTRTYWSLAKRFALADHAFASTRFGFFPNQLYLVAGTTQIAPSAWVVGESPGAHMGCDSPPGTQTTVLSNGKIEPDGPFPCFTQFRTMANLFDKAGISWKYYSDPTGFDPFDAIRHVFEGRDRKRDLVTPATQLLTDIAQHNLAAVSWVLSPYADSDAPGTRGGPRWVDAVVRAVQKSSYWSASAVVVVWDNEGNGQHYDDVAPPQLDDAGLGFRVPMIVISPYAKRHYVSHTQYEFGSLLKFIEENWSLPPLGGYATDQRANSVADMFDFGR